jgi:hypothetical protein
MWQAYGRVEELARFWCGDLRERGNLEDRTTEGRIILA